MSFESSKLYSVRRIVAGFGKVPFVSIYCAVMGGFFSIVLPLFLFNLAGKISAMLCRHFSMKMSLLCGKFNYFLLNVFYANIFHQNERQQQIHERHGAVDNDELGNSDHNNNNNSISTKKQILCQQNTLQNTRNTETLFTFSSDNKNFEISKTHQFMHRKISTFSLFYLFFFNNLEELLSSLIYSRFDLICCA